MDMNEFRGRVLKVNLAKPQRGPVQGAGNRASTCETDLAWPVIFVTYVSSTIPVWESEEWLQTHAQHAAGREGVKARMEEEKDRDEQNNDAMEE